MSKLMIFLCVEPGMLAGTGYPSGSNTRAGTGMGKFSYPRADTGNPTGKFTPSGYGYGMAIPDGYLPVAISIQKANKLLWLSTPS